MLLSFAPTHAVTEQTREIDRDMQVRPTRRNGGPASAISSSANADPEEKPHEEGTWNRRLGAGFPHPPPCRVCSRFHGQKAGKQVSIRRGRLISDPAAGAVCGLADTRHRDGIKAGASARGAGGGAEVMGTALCRSLPKLGRLFAYRSSAGYGAGCAEIRTGSHKESHSRVVWCAAEGAYATTSGRGARLLGRARSQALRDNSRDQPCGYMEPKPEAAITDPSRQVGTAEGPEISPPAPS